MFGTPLNPRQSADRPGLPPRLTSTVLSRDSEVLSLDVFGLALERLVTDPVEVHGLVAVVLARGGHELEGRYPELRMEAERQAMAHARAEHRSTIGLAEIADQLEILLTARSGPLARQAIECEVELEQRLSRANPDAVRLVAEARARGIRTAFMADTYLPRDLVALMLRSAGMPADLVLVSSHAGVTKADGRLFGHLAQRAGVPPGRITHVGPDPAIDVQMAGRMGLRGECIPARPEGPELSVGLSAPTALDSAALALAARVSGCHRSDDDAPLSIGYYAGGPLAIGFTAWVGQLMDSQQPDHVLFCGLAGGLLHQLAAIVRPDLPGSRLHHVPWACEPAGTVENLDQTLDLIGLRAEDRLLVVDLGWDHPRSWVSRRLAESGRSNQVCEAALGLLEAPADRYQVMAWAFSGEACDPATDLAQERIEVLEALLRSAPLDDRSRRLPAQSRHYVEAAPSMAEGIRRFARDFEPWLRFDPHRTSRALAEPALRVITRPTRAEARLLGCYPAPGHDATTWTPLAGEPDDGHAPGHGLEAPTEPGALWLQGYRALRAAPMAEERPGRARRLARRRPVGSQLD